MDRLLLLLLSLLLWLSFYLSTSQPATAASSSSSRAFYAGLSPVTFSFSLRLCEFSYHITRQGIYFPALPAAAALACLSLGQKEKPQ